MNNKATPDKALHIKKFIPGIAWFFVILILVCIPGYDLPKVDKWLIEINFDKMVHVGIFTVLVYLFVLPLARSSMTLKEKWHYAIKITLAAAVYGLITELLQKFYIPGRSFNLSDVAADALGGVITLIYCRIRLFKNSPKPVK